MSETSQNSTPNNGMSIKDALEIQSKIKSFINDNLSTQIEAEYRAKLNSEKLTRAYKDQIFKERMAEDLAFLQTLNYAENKEEIFKKLEEQELKKTRRAQKAKDDYCDYKGIRCGYFDNIIYKNNFY